MACLSRRDSGDDPVRNSIHGRESVNQKSITKVSGPLLICISAILEKKIKTI